MGYIMKKVPPAQFKYWIRRATSKKPQAVKTIINSVNKNMQLEFLSMYGFSLRYITKQTEELCIAAVTNNPLAIKFVAEQTPAIQKIVIDSKNSEAIGMLTHMSQPVATHLVSVKPQIIEKIKKPSPQLIETYNKTILQNDKNARRLKIENGVTPNDLLVYKAKLKEQIKTVIQNHGYNIEIIDNTLPVYNVINMLSELIHPQKADIATGYLFESGLGMLKPTFNLFLNNGVKTTLTVGALQNYHTQLQTHGCVTDMDLQTAVLLNKYIKSDLIKLQTYPKTFYHGKFYYIQGRTVSFIIIGSSNVSASGLSSNRELNTLYIFHNSNNIMESGIKWYHSFSSECTYIDTLNEMCFVDHKKHSETIAYELTPQAMHMHIQSLTDKERQERLNMWLSKSPSCIYKLKEGCTKAFDGYIVIQYEDYNLCILESFDGGNAFYCFNTSKFNDIEKDLKTKTKAQLFSHPLLIKRGYHSSDMFSLMLNINSLF